MISPVIFFKQQLAVKIKASGQNSVSGLPSGRMQLLSTLIFLNISVLKDTSMLKLNNNNHINMTSGETPNISFFHR